MTTRAQAVDAAHRWINGELPRASADAGTGSRAVHAHEFDLGWVLWADPSPVRVDPLTGERRAPEEIGAACAVVDRVSGELSVWPSVPVPEVVRLYRDSRGAGCYDPALPPATGPGARAELTYRDELGAERTLALRSGPGLPHPALRAWRQLQSEGVRAEDVLAVHTDLRIGALPGGYWAHALAAELPTARVGFDIPYGPRADARARALRALPEPPAEPGRPAPARRNRVPFPRSVPAAPAEHGRTLAARLEEQFGPQGVRCFDPADVGRADLPEVTARTLLAVGVPVLVEGYFALHHPLPDGIADGSRPGRVLPPVAEHLAELGRGTLATVRAGRELVSQLLIGTDGWSLITVDTARGVVRAVDPDHATARHCNADLTAFVRCLALFADWLPRVRGLHPYAAGQAVAELQWGLAALDRTVFEDPESWWGVLVEQFWDGLL
ncbi:SUKH-4 family immunity protein [Kitasatospora sp. NPDC057015]|uniref:SUKH-4 family immunity protein n=1 Tax=Kitasatospora sp. NPDC057015 TaxID=3346001 RepID=UPI0036374892